MNEPSYPKITVLVVVYNCELFQSETINSLIEHHKNGFDFELVVWDNSPSPAAESDQLMLASVINKSKYICQSENVWLSKVYNKVVDSNEFDYIILLDQDTILPDEFFRELLSNINKYPLINLFLPLVTSKEKLVSPGSLFFFKGTHWKYPKTGIINSKNVLAIMSGMTISKKYIIKNSYKFDERLNLYGIDTSFMLNFAKNENELCVLTSTFIHHTVLWSNPPADIMLRRLKNLKSTWPIIFEDNLMAKFLAYLHALAVSVKYAVKYKDMRFLKN